MNVQQRATQLALKQKRQENQAETKLNSYEDIESAFSEEQKSLIGKYYIQLSPLGFKREEDVYYLCKKFEFNEKILDDHVKVLLTKSKEAEENDGGWVTVNSKTSKDEKISSDYSNKQSRQQRKVNEGTVSNASSTSRGNYSKKQNETEFHEQKNQRKQEDNEHESGGYKAKERYYQKSYRNDEEKPYSFQEENSGYQRGGTYKQRDRNYNSSYGNKGLESRKDRDLVYYAKKEDLKANETKHEEPKKVETKPEPEQQQQPASSKINNENTKQEIPKVENKQAEKNQTIEVREVKPEQRVEKVVEEESDENTYKKSRSPKKGKNERVVYAVKKEPVEEPAQKTLSQDHVREQPQHNDASKTSRVSPMKTIEHTPKEQKVPTKQQETLNTHQPQQIQSGVSEKERHVLEKERSAEILNKESDKNVTHNLAKTNEGNLQRSQPGKNIAMHHATQTSYTPLTTTAANGKGQSYSTQNKLDHEELPKTIKSHNQTTSSTQGGVQPQSNTFIQPTSFPPGNLQGIPTQQSIPQIQLQGGNQNPLAAYFSQPQQVPQTFLPPFNTFPIINPQTQGEQKDVPQVFQMPYIVFPQSNGTAIIQPLYFSPGFSPMMPTQNITQNLLGNPLNVNSQNQVPKSSTNQVGFDVSGLFRPQNTTTTLGQTDDNISKNKSTLSTQGNSDRPNENNTQKTMGLGGSLQESGLYYPLYNQNQSLSFQQFQGSSLMNQFKANPTNDKN